MIPCTRFTFRGIPAASFQTGGRDVRHEGARPTLIEMSSPELLIVTYLNTDDRRCRDRPKARPEDAGSPLRVLSLARLPTEVGALQPNEQIRTEVGKGRHRARRTSSKRLDNHPVRAHPREPLAGEQPNRIRTEPVLVRLGIV